MLLKDLFESKSCNRLLEPESNEDVWRDAGNRSYEYDDFVHDDPGISGGQYLKANLNARWSPGKFCCPEIWKTKFSLHPRLKQNQHNNQSWGIQSIRNIFNHLSLVAVLLQNYSDFR